ncbi:MAG: MotA/TolQ/ExbB proton channel family protein [Planctomycetota bacterium]|jgi:chemotaxis protein MotA|nr:MotA/TolQ/ExbB proton channel family protein [Planctomycetota bacterium]
MDIATVAGLCLGVALLLIGIQPQNLQYFIDPGSLLIVAGGTTASLLINYPLGTVLRVMGIVKNTVLFKSVDLEVEINRMVEFATIARRDGLLALEERLESLEDPFLLRGIQMIIDGVAPESVRSIMDIELTQVATRHSGGKGVIDAAGSAAPAFGMIGTLVGLILMLQNLDDPSALGPGMAIALITTFYGAVLANLMFIPLAGKLGARNNEEVLTKQVMIEGVLAIQAGENPNVIRERLNGFMSPNSRVSDERE